MFIIMMYQCMDGKPIHYQWFYNCYQWQDIDQTGQMIHNIFR